MLVHDREIMQGAEDLVVPAYVWLYPPLEYVEQVHGAVWIFKSLFNSAFKGVRRVCGREKDVTVAFAGVSHESANGYVQRVPQVLDNISDNRSEVSLRESVFSLGDPGDTQGLYVEIGEGFISIGVHESLKKAIEINDMAVGPI
jgi:hypothetical protein